MNKFIDETCEKISKNLDLKVRTHEATNHCNTLLQQIALCLQSSDKSYSDGLQRQIAWCEHSTFGGKSIKTLSPRQNFVAATCRTKLNQFDFVRHVAATKILSRRQNFR